MSKFIPPKYHETQFHCVHCGVFAKQRWVDLYFGYQGSNKAEIDACRCDHCGKFSYWHGDKLVVPASSTAPPAHEDTPTLIQCEVEEARAVVAASPRAAAALLRLAIQKLMPVLGEKGENINDDIKALVDKGLPIQVQMAFDFCRVVGNNAVHPGEIDINDSPEVAHHLFEMINFIIEDRITRPKHVHALYQQLPEASRAAIEKRDGKKG